MNAINDIAMSFWNGIIGLNFSYILSLVVFVLVITFLLKQVYAVLLKTLKTRAELTETDIDDKILAKFETIRSTYFLILITWVVAWFVASSTGGKIFGTSIVFKGLSILALISTIIEGLKFIDLSIYYFAERKSRRIGEKVDETRIGLITLLIRLGVWVTAFFVGLGILGVNSTNIFGAAGVGAIVLGFALQNVLGDLLSSLSIYLDRPFRIGDTINIGGVVGTVKRTGLKSTRLQKLSGEEVVLSNTVLLNSQISNYRRMEKRRVEFMLHLTSMTSKPQIKALLKAITAYFEKQDTKLTRNRFSAIEPGFITIDIVFILDNPDYENYMEFQEELNFVLLDILAKNKITLATNSLFNYPKSL